MKTVGLVRPALGRPRGECDVGRIEVRLPLVNSLLVEPHMLTLLFPAVLKVRIVFLWRLTWKYLALAR